MKPSDLPAGPPGDEFSLPPASEVMSDKAQGGPDIVPDGIPVSGKPDFAGLPDDLGLPPVDFCQTPIIDDEDLPIPEFFPFL